MTTCHAWITMITDGGMPSNHKVFGEANAVLAGDGLLSLAFDTMLAAIANNPCQGEIKAAQAVSEGAGVQGMVAGQGGGPGF